MNEKNLIKFASFYVSDWHLTTMLVPYINKNLEDEVKIITILEENLYDNMETLIKKLNFNNKEKILELNWKKINPLNYEIIDKKINEQEFKKLCVIINGSEKYIQNANSLIEKVLIKSDIKKTVKIVNCFELTKLSRNIDFILDNHDMLINTSGERKKEDIYKEYVEKG